MRRGIIGTEKGIFNQPVDKTAYGKSVFADCSMEGETIISMKRPKYMEELLKIICLLLGAAFVCTGILGLIGVEQPKATSLIQDPVLLGISFLIIGLLVIITGIILGVISARKSKLSSELLISGTKVKGVVENVYLQGYTHYGTQSPYRIQYTYSYNGKKYHHKSGFIWEKPNLRSGDTIMVYVNDYGKSNILLEIEKNYKK